MPIHHVLVVDDSKSARLMLRKMLQGFGITVDTVESAEEALEYLRGQQPDGIFMDHTMPGMDGLTALTRIKADANLAAIPVAMYTSKDEPGYLNHALATGAVGVLVKPAMPDVLGAILDTMRTAAVAAKAPPSPEPLDMTVTAEWVGKLALEKAEQVFYDSIESQVLPLPEGRNSPACTGVLASLGKKEMPSAVSPEDFEGEEGIVAVGAPELAGAFEAALELAAGRFDRP